MIDTYNKKVDFVDFSSFDNIIGEIEFVYPIKNGIESARQNARKWVKECVGKVS